MLFLDLPISNNGSTVHTVRFSTVLAICTLRPPFRPHGRPPFARALSRARRCSATVFPASDSNLVRDSHSQGVCLRSTTHDGVAVSVGSEIRGLTEIGLLSIRLRQISFNFCLSLDQFGDLLQLRQSPLFRPLLQQWFDAFKNTKTSSIVNGLEILTALTIASVDGKLIDKINTVFDLFDFDNSGAITIDELTILLKSAIRGLSKLTKGLGPRLAVLGPMKEVEELSKQCFKYCDLDEEQDITREAFTNWAKHSPKIVNLIRCFVQKEFLTQEEAAIVIQRCTRGMYGRRITAELRLEKQLELDAEITQAAQKIQDAIKNRKKRRDSMREKKIERFAQHGALYTFGSNSRGHLGHANLDITKNLYTPMLTLYFRNNELRVVNASLSPVHACAVTSDGKMFTWGAGVPGSFGFILNSHRSTTTAGMTSQEKETATGIVRKTPTAVEDLDNVNIVNCCLGNHHSIALTENGALYSWGSGEYGQLGHGDFNGDTNDIFKRQFDQHTSREYPYVDLPLQLDKSLFEEMRVLQVACGYYFTVALCEDGSVFTWGEGSDGQLGLGFNDSFQVGFLDEHIHGASFIYMHSPCRVNDLKEPIDHISVGGNHVFAVAKDSRHVFEWGAWNRRIGTTQDSAFAPQVNEELNKLYVGSIATGKEHALAITASIKVELSGLADPMPALCAKFGPSPASLVATIEGSVLSCASAASTSTSQDYNDISHALLVERNESSIRLSLGNCLGKVVYFDRGVSSGHWITLISSRPMIDVPCVPAKFGPSLSDMGTVAKLFFSPQKLRSLRLFVRPDEIIGKAVVLEFSQNDLVLDSSNIELSEMILRIMVSLVERVKDAQESGASAVIIVFDFLEAQPFALEPCEDDTFKFLIPVVMVSRAHGDIIIEHVQKRPKPYALLCWRNDILTKQIVMAQKLGAKAVIVGQNYVERNATRLPVSIFEDNNGGKAKDSLAVRIPVVMISHSNALLLKEAARQQESGLSATISIGEFGDLYAWGYGSHGRLGLGDLEDDQVFQTGFDNAHQMSYQYAGTPQLVSTLFPRRIVHASCGNEHSAAVTSDGDLYCWGSGRDGKLGNGTEEDELLPQVVDALSKVCIVRVECGTSQTVC